MRFSFKRGVDISVSPVLQMIPIVVLLLASAYTTFDIFFIQLIPVGEDYRIMVASVIVLILIPLFSALLYSCSSNYYSIVLYDTYFTAKTIKGKLQRFNYTEITRVQCYSIFKNPFMSSGIFQSYIAIGRVTLYFMPETQTIYSLKKMTAVLDTDNQTLLDFLQKL